MILRILITCLFALPVFAQGQTLAPANWRPLTGKTCKSETDFPQLNGYAFDSGKVLGDAEDIEQRLVHVFVKGSTTVLFFLLRQDDSRLYIVDVVEIRNLLPIEAIMVGTCSDGERAIPGLVALVKKTPGRWSALKAWNYNLDKLTVQMWPAGGVTCLADQGEN